jgi:hypothetical protein
MSWDWIQAELPPGDPKNWPPEGKVALITAMGFSPIREDRHPDCPHSGSAGYPCSCVPDATVWSQPPDVDFLRHETWEERFARAQKRSSGQG